MGRSSFIVYSAFMDDSTVRIEKVVAGGKGLCRLDGRVVFVPGTLPGELVSVGPIRYKKDFGETELVSVLEAHPGRIEPPCRHYGECGGCDFQYANPELQVELKVEIIKDAWMRLAKLVPPEVSVHRGPSVQYRNRMQVHTNQTGFPCMMGRKSNDLVPIPDCIVASPAIQPYLKSGAGKARNGRSEDGRTHRRTVFDTGSGPLAADGPDFVVSVRIAGKNIRFPLGGFFQSNMTCLELLISWVKDHIKDEQKDTLLDIYGGVGTFACTLGESFAKVWVIEEFRPSAEWASRNIPASTGRVFCGTVAEWAQKFPVMGEQALVVLDPPREGLDKALLTWIADNKPHTLVYISCNPVTQARDAAGLASFGYHFDNLALFDFYPQTWHMESCLIARYHA